MSDLLIEAKELRQRVSDNDILVFDVRSDLRDPLKGERVYREGHIPGAYFLNQNTQLAGTCTGKNGRHPLPERQQLQQLLQDYGLTPESQVVVYDQNDSSFAARAWWLLRWAGHPRVAVLNGGLQAWQEAGGSMQTGVNSPSSTDTASTATNATTMPTVSAQEVLERDSAQVLVDARTPERYRGESEPLDPVAGRIEHALNRPVASNVTADGRFKSAQHLHDEFHQLLRGASANRVIHYCGSGITACHNVFAMEIAGLKGSALYPGSWSEWCSDPSRPVAKG